MSTLLDITNPQTVHGITIRSLSLKDCSILLNVIGDFTKALKPNKSDISHVILEHSKNIKFFIGIPDGFDISELTLIQIKGLFEIFLELNPQFSFPVEVLKEKFQEIFKAEIKG
ncbi:MAG: hypothetical protein KAI17_09290 [Thiotrichaceae bacterium]|nr:hypothetical protein [Thiotrichaceae bacterium]